MYSCLNSPYVSILLFLAFAVSAIISLVIIEMLLKAWVYRVYRVHVKEVFRIWKIDRDRLEPGDVVTRPLELQVGMLRIVSVSVSMMIGGGVTFILFILFGCF